MSIKENYYKKANNLIERLGDEEEMELPIKRSSEEAIEPEDIDRRPSDVAGNTRRASKEPEKKFEMDDEGDIGTETAKAMLATYIDRCVEEGVKELGDEYGLEDVEGSYEIVQDEIERIAGQLKNYLKKGVQ